MSKHHIVRVGNSGVHTVEGTVSGALASHLSKEREKQVLQYESQKSYIIEQNKSRVRAFGDKFSSGESKQDNAGVVASQSTKEHVSKAQSTDPGTVQEDAKSSEPRSKKKRKATVALSFADEDGDEETPIPQTKTKRVSKVGKDPKAATSFLPDRERDEQIEAKRRMLREEWLDSQSLVQKEMLQVVFSYWDGSGHRKTITVAKGSTIEEFLKKALELCRNDFRDLRAATADNLMYIKEDLIIPHQLSFYDLIITKARGKSGPLFHFDVHDDIRLLGDSRVEKDESHPGKVCLRSWYERNKHLFPANRWEVFDPEARREAKYTIHGA